MRSSTQDQTYVIIPPRNLSLEQALEFLREDECLEVTPKSVRLRKVMLTTHERSKNRKHAAYARS
jgi:GTP-binding protein